MGSILRHKRLPIPIYKANERIIQVPVSVFFVQVVEALQNYHSSHNHNHESLNYKSESLFKYAVRPQNMLLRRNIRWRGSIT